MIWRTDRDSVALATNTIPAMTRSERFWLGVQLGAMAVIFIGMGVFARESIADPIEKLPVWRVLACGPVAPHDKPDLAAMRRCDWIGEVPLERAACISVERSARARLKTMRSVDCIVDQQVLVRMRGGQIDGPPLSGIPKAAR